MQKKLIFSESETEVGSMTTETGTHFRVRTERMERKQGGFLFF